MKKLFALALLVLLVACQSSPPKPEDDLRYAKLAIVMDRHEFTELERKQAKANKPSDSGISIGLSVGTGSGGGMMSGAGMMAGARHDSRDEMPQVVNGANRFTVQPLDNGERVEIMSTGRHKVGECVKVLVGHPTMFSRFLDLKPDEHCK